MIDDKNKAIVETRTYTRFRTGRAWIADYAVEGNDWGVFLLVSNGATYTSVAFSIDEAKEITRLIQEAIVEAETSEPIPATNVEEFEKIDDFE